MTALPPVPRAPWWVAFALRGTDVWTFERFDLAREALDRFDQLHAGGHRACFLKTVLEVGA